MEYVKSVVLSDADLELYTELMATVHPVVAKWCKKIYGSNEWRQFRLDYVSGKLRKYKIPLKDQASIEMLQSIELPLLQHNVRIIHSLASYYWTRNKHKIPILDVEDYEQEASQALVECIYGHNGSTKFVTYCITAIKNRLNDFVRVWSSSLSSPSPEIAEMARAVAKEMAHHKTFDQVVKEMKLDKNDILNCRAAMQEVFSQVALTNDDGDKLSLSDLAAAPNDELPKDYDEMMMEAYRTTILSDIERTTFEAYMVDGEHGYQTQLAEVLDVSRAAISAAFQRAKRKIRDRYLELAPSEANALREAA